MKQQVDRLSIAVAGLCTVVTDTVSNWSIHFTARYYCQLVVVCLVFLEVNGK